MAEPLQQQHLDYFRQLTSPVQAAAWLRQAAAHALPQPALLKTYHDLLLYTCAFPGSRSVLEAATDELNRLTSVVEQIASGKNRAAIQAITGDGIMHTSLICSFSYGVVCWLADHFPGDVAIHDSNAESESIVAVLQQLLPAIEYEKTTQRPLGLVSRIKSVSGIASPGRQLQWLLRCFRESGLDDQQAEFLYQQLGIFVSWNTSHPLYNRSQLRIPVTKFDYPQKLLVPADPAAILREPVKPVRLHLSEKERLTGIMRASLAFYCRETDPFTDADPAATARFEMGNGLTIVLAGMKKNKRLSLESYIGYMAFQNGIPVAYGGGWIWGQRCRIGLSIYPSFRKGASAWLFCQVMRLYHQYFRATHFIIRPYQFGKANPEGIRSGAFWFYYKLGFRPNNTMLDNLAASEWNKKQTGQQYRTPPNILKQFTGADLEWMPGKSSLPSFGADVLSAAITKMLNQSYQGSRKTALAYAESRFKQVFSAADLRVLRSLPEKMGQSLLLLFLFTWEIRDWNQAEKSKWLQAWALKVEGAERNHLLQIQKHRLFWKALHDALHARVPGIKN